MLGGGENRKLCDGSCRSRGGRIVFRGVFGWRVCLPAFGYLLLFVVQPSFARARSGRGITFSAVAGEGCVWQVRCNGIRDDLVVVVAGNAAREWRESGERR
jgi:hypothetical protein